MLATANAISQPRSLDLDARERSRSEGEALSSNNVCKRNKQSGGGGGDFEDLLRYTPNLAHPLD